MLSTMKAVCKHYKHCRMSLTKEIMTLRVLTFAGDLRRPLLVPKLWKKCIKIEKNDLHGDWKLAKHIEFSVTSQKKAKSLESCVKHMDPPPILAVQINT